MKKVKILIVLKLAALNITAQTVELFNNGDTLYVNNDVLFVNGSIENTNNGIFDNYGQIYLTHNWINNAGNSAFSNSSNGEVILIGINQNIQGTDATDFYTLSLLGTGIKKLNGINANVLHQLNLYDSELATDVNTLFIKNTAINAIQRNSGFVSSELNGALSREMSLGLPYLFPVGSSNGILRYRPVKIKPTLNANVTYTVRMANVLATSEGFDINTKEPKISQINPNYYHLISRTNGTQAADLYFYYDIAQDGNFLDVAHWQNLPRWESINAQPDAPENNLNSLRVDNWNDYTNPAFAFVTDFICSDFFFPTIFSPNGDGLNDEQCLLGNCIESAYWAVYNRWGEKVFETEDKNNCWDGTYKGISVNTGVFVYYLKLTLSNGEIINQKGNLSIVR